VVATSRRLAANLVFGVASNLIRLGTQLVMLPVMARILGPAELGLYALAIPMINFVMLLTDAGLGDSLARESDDRSPAWSTAFWTLLGASVVGAAGAIVASLLMADVAAQPRLPAIVICLSVTLPLLAMMVIPNARMLRSGNTVPAAFAEIVATLTGAGVGVAAALYGFGVWALVIQFVTTCAARTVSFNIAQPFLPKFIFCRRSLLSHSGMGSQIMSGRLLELGASMFERSRISSKLGAAAVGGYANAIQIGTFTVNAVGSPLWANLYHLAITRDEDEVTTALLKAHRTFSLLVFPVVAVLAIGAPTFVPLLLGDAWRPSIGAIVVMLLSAPFGNLAAFHSAILFARGEGRYVLIGQAITIVLRLILVILFWRIGIFGLALGLGLVNFLYYGATNLFISQRLGFRPELLFATAARPLVVTGVGAAVLMVILGDAPSLAKLVYTAAGAGPLYIGLLLALDRAAFRQDLLNILRLLGLHRMERTV
jgi:O-antigen/teichoic acid export membrane protein